MQVNGLLFQGKTTDAVKAYNNQVFKSVDAQERIDEFNDMNIIKQKMVADGLGMTVKEFQKSLAVQADQANLTEAELEALDKQQKLTDELKNKALTGLEKITRIFRPVFNQIFETLLGIFDSIDFQSMANTVKEIFSPDNIKGFVDKIVSGFQKAKDFAMKIYEFVAANPKLSVGLLAGFFALKKGIGLLTGGAFGSIAKILPMALKALPVVGMAGGAIVAGIMAFKNLSKLLGGRDKADRIEKTKALSSTGGMMVGAGIGAIFGPIGMAIGAALGGFIGGTDFGQKLFKGIFPESTITKMISMFDNLRDVGDTLVSTFQDTDGSLGEKLGNALREAFNKIEWFKLFGSTLTIVTDALAFVTDIIGGIFGIEGLGKNLKMILDDTLNFALSFVRTIPDQLKILVANAKLIMLKLPLIGGDDAEVEAQVKKIANLKKQMQSKIESDLISDPLVGTGGFVTGQGGVLNRNRKQNDAVIKGNTVTPFNPNDTAILTQEGFAPDMSETNELLRQLIAQNNNMTINMDGQKVGQAIANSRYRN